MVTPKMRTPYGIVPEPVAEWLVRNSVLHWRESEQGYAILTQYVPTVRCKEHGYDKEKQRFTGGHKCNRAVGDIVIQRLVNKSEGQQIASEIVGDLASGRIDYRKLQAKVLAWLAGVGMQEDNARSATLGLQDR